MNSREEKNDKIPSHKLHYRRFESLYMYIGILLWVINRDLKSMSWHPTNNISQVVISSLRRRRRREV